jgi:hypothetical protein
MKSNIFQEENETFVDYQDLEIPYFHDLVTSCLIYDATFNGYNSIVLGTFGKVLLFFCLCGPSELNNFSGFTSQNSSESKPNLKKVQPNEKSNNNNNSEEKQALIYRYELKKEIPFKHSILGLELTKLSNNGAYDIVVLTLNGISVWQYDPERLIELINQKFEQNENTCLEKINKLINTQN